MRTGLLIICLMIIRSVVALAGTDHTDYNIKVLNGSSGPSCAQVETIYVDPDGILWLGTAATVERYDGKEYLVWSFPKRTEFPDENRVTAITRDAKGEYWVGNNNGVWKLNFKTFKLDRVLEEIKVPVSRIYADKSNRIYIATIRGLYIYNDGKLQHQFCDKTNNPGGNFLSDIIVESSTHVWGVTPDGIVRNNTDSGIFNKYNLNDTETFGSLKSFVKTGDIIYVGTEKKGVLKFSTKTGSYSTFADLWRSPVTSLSIIAGHTLAVGTAGDGLSLLDLRDGKPIYNARYENGLASNSILSVVPKDDNIWLGSPYYVGLTRISRDDTKFKVFEKGDFKTSNRSVISFLHTQEYTFTGTRDGFFVTDHRSGKTSYLAKGMPGAEALTSNIIFSFFKYGNEYLVGTCYGGLYRLDPETMTLSVPDVFAEMKSNDIFSSITLDDRNRLWIPTRGGLFCYDQAAGKVKGYTTMNSNLPSNIVYSILIDRKKRFWVATDRGVRLFNPETGAFSLPRLHPSLLHHSVVRYLNEDSRGNLFFCTIYDELWMADSSLSKCDRLFADKKINVRNIEEDRFGNYWIGTAADLIKTDSNLNVLTTYSATDVIPDLEASSGPQMKKDPDGRIWMAGAKGLIEIFPFERVTTPTPKLVSVSIDGITVMDISDSGLRPLVLDKAHNNVSFHLMDSTYSDASHICFEYKLEGYDNEWRIGKGGVDVSYFDLPPGKYRFMLRPYLSDKVSETLEVKVKGSSGVWIAIIVLAAAVGTLGYLRRKQIIKIALRCRFINKGARLHLAAPEDPAEKEEEIQKMKISDIEMEEMLTAVKKYLEESKAYLNPDLKKPELAAATGYSSQMLSLMLNGYLKIGYYDFINAYRVETFKRLISDGANERFTLKTIADMSGFSSHTSFFRTFKKFTGVTPNDYIRSQQTDNQ